MSTPILMFTSSYLLLNLIALDTTGQESERIPREDNPGGGFPSHAGWPAGALYPERLASKVQ
ncbi:hypothetical protein [Streptomyces luteogriseus]|uniref:hypothetical protein n=1 Tax=Streptomyces luteogriseus TaxID=68233 RepID=UPI0037B8D3F6